MKKIFKISLYVIVGLIIIVAIGIPIFITYERNNRTVETFEFKESNSLYFSNIKWVSDSLGGERIDKVAFFVPVKIKGLQDNLFMQFDTGTPTTVFYGKTLKALDKSSTILKTFYSKDSVLFVDDPILEIGKSKFVAKRIRVLPGMGTSKIDTSFITIGTLGFDVIVNRTLILDFKNNKIAITNKNIKELGYSLNLLDDVSVNKFPFLISAKLNNHSIRLLYDTGSSMFPIITSNNKLIETDKLAKIDTICCISAWGKKYKVTRKKLNIPINIGNVFYNDKFIYGIERLKIFNYFPDWFLFGITGNKLFDNKIIVIDTKNNNFGISK